MSSPQQPDVPQSSTGHPNAQAGAQQAGAPQPDALRTLFGQLAITDESIRSIFVILAGILLSLCATLQQRGYLQRLICGTANGEKPPDTACLRIAGALLVLSSLFFFTRLSRTTLCNAQTEETRCAADIDYKGNLLVVSVALARLWLMLCAAGKDGAAADDEDGAAVDSAGEIA